MLRKKGFTLVEIMIVVAIIGLLAAIAIPNFVRARTLAATNACVANLKQLQGAAQVYALDTGAAGTVTVTSAATDLAPNYVKKWPSCGSTPYASFVIDTGPVCPIDPTNHKL